LHKTPLKTLKSFYKDRIKAVEVVSAEEVVVAAAEVEEEAEEVPVWPDSQDINLEEELRYMLGRHTEVHKEEDLLNLMNDYRILVDDFFVYRIFVFLYFLIFVFIRKLIN